VREVIIERVLNKKLIAIIRGTEKDLILPLAEALLKGGINMMEITFNQAKPESDSDVADSIVAIKKNFGADVSVGAGTVIRIEQLERAQQAGATYIISPHTDVALIQKTRKMGLVSIPGALTPSECVIAAAAGADFVKLFPMSNLGPEYLKALKAPLCHLRFLCVGGINESNIASYVKIGSSGFGVGGNLVNKDWVTSGQFEKITALAQEYVRAINEYKKERNTVQR
jgi:2-dehydro-3-deoxyphosphogluconate aldolase/(4S)-4-hydroxy-2-oxoglutarate aldolase